MHRYVVVVNLLRSRQTIEYHHTEEPLFRRDPCEIQVFLLGYCCVAAENTINTCARSIQYDGMALLLSTPSIQHRDVVSMSQFCDHRACISLG